MKTFGMKDYMFNMEKFGENKADRIQYEKFQKLEIQFRDIEYHINNFSKLNYKEQLDFITYMMDSIDVKECSKYIQTSNNKETIKMLLDIIRGRDKTGLMLSAFIDIDGKRINDPIIFNKNFLLLNIGEKINSCIFILTGCYPNIQYNAYKQFIINKNKKYQELYEMLVTVTNVIEKYETFDVVDKVTKLYKAADRDNKIEELFID